jgi:hypothetical protein
MDLPGRSRSLTLAGGFSLIDKGYSIPRKRADDFANRLGIRLPILGGALCPGLRVGTESTQNLVVCERYDGG